MKTFALLMTVVISACLLSCKSQNVATSAPFEISEKSYFQWISGKQGTKGTTIRVEGRVKSLNVSFSKLYFQNHEYDVVPQFSDNVFVVEGTSSEFRNRELILSSDPADEYGNQPSLPKKKIPFDLKDDEAVLLYTVNGLEGFYKISDIVKLDQVYKP
ncbi:hypothetical protein [Lutimonas zeaxanthinifaciens]|uniref:hypothetical protein n=1 Tax=Lutimonas zeaxanthinifaciens TaxID=3060215 RepID=UPI00265CE715|nr:hypothetical protein [Lutimonas sp. YSD2104]WKK65946.1 hypothetical protein QZH61_15330 [Lutimonas sp. YSD2104]